MLHVEKEASVKIQIERFKTINAEAKDIDPS
jgi:hypothetical protein